ncbi:DUF3365 domain-containing protein [Methylococcus sp. Mc7]|jgi:hypothetical protein|uniref:Tll0287-like domain-containing protein n=1 Tax=Methylococcus sp. Mc7 TaxID=2860258 RepID=UPI001C527510|nr:DUF3365 domain-containing protein [Methylococcus sp. Mc7]QXP85218.1 DUF3365 domain-containing protein [Methylococcus sp. Mc7]
MQQRFLMIGLAVVALACIAGGKQDQAGAIIPKAEQAHRIESVRAPSPVDEAALVEKAKAAVRTLGSALKAALEAALRAGRQVDALSVCQLEAPAIASQVSAQSGMQVSRVSLKYRNINNAPTEWQSQVLNDFENRKIAGENPANLSYAKVVGNEFRFMKAIPIEGVCLGCHGDAIGPAIKSKLSELYPQDLATGYREGDLRGAFVVVQKLAP